MKLFSKKIRAVGFAVVLAISFSASYVSAPVAHAAPCSPANGYIDGWDGTNTCATFLWSYAYNIVGVGGCKNLGSPNATSYVWNNSNSLYWAWTGPNCTGSHGPLYAKTAGPMTGSWDNNIESVQRKN